MQEIFARAVAPPPCHIPSATILKPLDAILKLLKMYP